MNNWISGYLLLVGELIGRIGDFILVRFLFYDIFIFNGIEKILVLFQKP